MTEQDIAKLKAAGFTDADIADYKANEVQTTTAVNPTPADQSLPEVDVTQKSDTLKNAEASGIPTTNPGSYMTDAMAIAQGLIPNGVGDTLMKLGEGALAYQGIKGWRENSAARAAQAQAEIAREQGIAQRAAQKAANVAQQGAQRVAPQAGQQAFNQMAQQVSKVGPSVPTGAPMTGPVNPATMSQAVNTAEQGLAARVRDAAAQRIANLPAMGEMLGGAARMAGRVLGPAGLALQTTDLGPQTPQLGRMRGMEINPMTGQRWTPDQIKQYEANPNMFDSQLAQPQFRR